MSFLQPMMLVALPLVALPIVIHLINQRRYQTTRWAAMMFLLAANRMSRGYARLRQWLILLFRMLAIAGLIFAVSRPLASGWLGLAAGGRADTTIILLDRSPSMQQQGDGRVISKLEAGRRRLVETLATLGSSRWVLIDSATKTPRELDSPEDLQKLPCTGPTSAEADLPAMLEAARDYIQANRTGRTEIWICSDLRANDWQADSRRWDALRSSFLELSQGVRFHLLAYPQGAPDNLAVRVTDVRRQQSGQDAELLVSLLLSRSGDKDDKVTVPVRFEIEGARSELTVEMVGPQYRLKDYRIPLQANQQRGWGRVSIPADANPANNDFYFVFDQPPPRKTIIVAEDPQAAWPLKLAASVSPDRTVACVAEVVSVEQLATVAWEQVSLLLWQAPLPQGEAAKMTQAFVRRGGQAIFLPPRSPDDGKLFGVAWQSWVAPPKEIPVETWRGDQGLLAHTLSGQSLPVGDLRVKRYCRMSGEFTHICHVARRRAAVGSRRHGSRRSPFLRNDPGAGRFLAGLRRRGSLRRGPAGVGVGFRGSRQHPQPDRRPTGRRYLGALAASGRRPAGFVDRLRVPPRRVRRGRSLAGRQSSRRRGPGGRAGRMRAWQGFSRVSTSSAWTIGQATPVR